MLSEIPPSLTQRLTHVALSRGVEREGGAGSGVETQVVSTGEKEKDAMTL